MISIIVAIQIQFGEAVSRFDFKSADGKVHAELTERKEKTLSLTPKDEQKISELISALLKEKPHEPRFCDRKNITLTLPSLETRLYCLDSKSKAGEDARHLQNLLALTYRLR